MKKLKMLEIAMNNINTKDQPSHFDGMQKAISGEPVFTLLGRDQFAWPLVIDWVNQKREHTAKADISEKQRKLDLIQCREAELIAWAMKSYFENGTIKEAQAEKDDAPPTYSGNTKTEKELKAKELFDIKKSISGLLNNCLSEILDRAEKLKAYGFEQTCNDIKLLAENMDNISNEIRPKRPSYSEADLEQNID